MRFLDFNKIEWPRDEKHGGFENTDVEAYLARFHIVLASDDWIYYRFASTDMNKPVPRMPWPTPNKPDFFVPETTEIMKKYKKDQTFKPDGYDLDYAADVPLILFFKGKAFDFVLIYNMFYLLWAY